MGKRKRFDQNVDRVSSKNKSCHICDMKKKDFGAKCEKYGTLPIYSYKTRTNILRIFLFSQLYLLCVTCTAQFFGVSLCPSRTPLISPLPPFLTFLSFPLKTLPLLDWIGLNKYFWLVASGVRLDQ